MNKPLVKTLWWLTLVVTFSKKKQLYKKKGLALKTNRPKKTLLKLASSSEEYVGNCKESYQETGTMDDVLWDIEMEEEEKNQEDMLINKTV